MHSGSQKYAPWGTSYYGRAQAYDVDDHLSRMNGSRRIVENSSTMNRETIHMPVQGGTSSSDTNENPEECECHDSTGL